MKIKKTIIRGLALGLMLTLLFAALIAPASGARYDYSSPNATSKVTLGADELLEVLFKDDDSFALTPEEREYLSEYCTDTLTYGTRVPSSYITSDFDEKNGILTVRAEVYSYKSLSGNITWVPSRVTFMGKNADFSLVDDEYVAEIAGASPGEEDNAEVLYTASISFSSDFINSLINKAYNDGAAWTSYKAYVDELRVYKENLALYEQYLIDKQIYNDKYKEYQAYLSEKAEYDEAYALFLQYEQDLAEYNTRYAAFVQYKSDLKAYNDALSLYNKYVANIKTADEQIATLVNTNKPLPTIGRPLYGAIMGPTVTQVVENKDAIANELTGVDGAVVDMAGEATEKLKEILPDFHKLKTDADRYLYYSLNYEQIRENFNKLFISLDYLYKNGKVRYALGEMEMKEKYEIFLAQLYYVVLALNDEPVYNYEGTAKYTSSYKINGKTPISLCEGEPYTPDVSTAKPLAEGYPQKVDEPTEPTEVEEPTRPITVARPTEPTKVEEPGEAPIEVTRPTAPATVKAPDASLVGIDGSLPSGILSLIEAYSNGRFTKREECTGDREIELLAYAAKRIVNVDSIVVNFYDENGESLLESVEAERGSYVEYTKDLPSKSSDDKIYTFAGWKDEAGNTVDMSCVDPDGDTLSLYPFFTWEYKSFDVVWNVLGELKCESYYYGEIPSYSGAAPTKPDEGSYMFIFDGWDEELSSVTEDKVYTAQFQMKPIVADPNGVAASIAYDADMQMYIVDCTESFSKAFELSELFMRAKNARVGVKLIMRTGTVIFPLSEVVKAYDSGAAHIKLVSLKREAENSTSYIFSVGMTSSDATDVDANVRATLVLPYAIENPGRMQICYDNNGVDEAVKYTAEDEKITISVTTGVQYYSLLRYNVGLMAYENIPISVSVSSAEAGERVKITYSLPDGLRLNSVYYTDDEGDFVYLDADIFDMPASDISIGISYEIIAYTVKFKSAGQVISSATYKYGEIPLPPGTPNIADDESYTYKFIGWDKEIGPVDSDITYTAVYERQEIAKEDNSATNGDKKDDITGGLKITPGVMRILLLALYAVISVPPIVLIITRTIVGIYRRTKTGKKGK